MVSLLMLSDEEDPARYKPGGYHPVSLGDVLDDQYLVIKKLGFGHFSTVWMVYDLERRKYWAMKIMRAAEEYTDAGNDEIEFLTLAATHADHPGYARIVQLIAHFQHTGPNGTHVCLVFELLGMTVNKLVSLHGGGLPVALVKSITQQVLEGLEFLHDVCQIIHTDLKLMNVMVMPSLPEYNAFVTDIVCKFRNIMEDPRQVRFYDAYGKRITDNAQVDAVPVQWDAPIQVKIGDLGNGCYTYRHYTSQIQTRQYRSPEVILGIDYNETSDVWSVACMVFKLLTGHLMFRPRETPEFSKEDHHLALMIQRLGPFPKNWMKTGAFYYTYFRSRARLRRKPPKGFKSVRDVLVQKYGLPVAVAEGASAFMAPMLQVIPEQRARATDCLKHPWLQDHF